MINGSDTENCWTSQSPTPQKCKLLNHGFISTFLGLTQAHTITLHVHKNIKQGTVYRRKYLISDSLEQTRIFNAPKKISKLMRFFRAHCHELATIQNMTPTVDLTSLVSRFRFLTFHPTSPAPLVTSRKARTRSSSRGAICCESVQHGIVSRERLKIE